MSYSNFFNSLASNVAHTLPVAFYTALGMAVKKDMPFIGKINVALPATFFAANIYARWDETNKLLHTQKEIAHHHHEIIAEYVVNAGVAIVGATVSNYVPGNDVFIVGAYLGGMTISGGEHSPVDYFKSGVTNFMDSVFGDHF